MNRDNLNGRVKRLERHQRRPAQLKVLLSWGEDADKPDPAGAHVIRLQWGDGPSIDLPDNGRAGPPKLS